MAGHQTTETNRDVPCSFHKRTLAESKHTSRGDFVGKSTLKTHSEIYQRFAEETEQLKKKQKDYECHNNNENNNGYHNQDLHFAKRLTWNLPTTEDKMQTSTDGNETPNMETNNTNLNLIISHSTSPNQRTRQYQDIQGI